jgi:hypothetical protein
MPQRPPSRWRGPVAWTLVVGGLIGPARAGEEPSPARPDTSRAALRRTPAAPGIVAGGSGWGWPLAGVALALAGLGWASLAARRSAPFGGREVGPIRVIGRTGLGPRHAVYVLRSGDRLLVVGTGPAGPPSLLATLSEPGQDGPPPGGEV